MLSERELHSRYEVYIEQYVIKTNIEAETTYDIAKTSILPAAIQYLNDLKIGRPLVWPTTSPAPDREVRAPRSRSSRSPTSTRTTRPTSPRKPTTCATPCSAKMLAVREVADELERIVPDYLWPLPKYREILFVK